MAYGSTELPSTAFAITTVNVPDQLDLREMDDRKQLEEESRRRFDLSGFRVWAPRLFLVALLAAIVFLAIEAVDTWRTALSAPQVSERLTTALGVPVQIESTSFALRPAPRLLLSKVSIGGKLVLGEIAINPATRHIAQVLQGRGLNWGEAVVGPNRLTIEQCYYLFKLLPKLDGALPSSLSTLRFDGLQIADQPWIAGPWQIDLVREGATRFAKVSAETRNGAGSLHFLLNRQPDSQAISFQMEGRDWLLPVGAPFPMEEVIAAGQVSPTSLELTEFSVGGAFGAAKGKAAAASQDGVWSLSGEVEADGLDLAALVRLLVPPPPGAEESKAQFEPVIQGNASFIGKFEGKGASIVEAVSGAVFAAPVQIRWPVLNGINLGYAATRPGASAGSGGGSTRFSALSAVVLAGGGIVSFRDIRGHAGAMTASGQVDMTSADHSLAGLLHVDLGATRILAPIRVPVRGTLARPQFGR